MPDLLHNITKYSHAFLSLFYPQCCPVCGKVLVKNENILCLSCYINLPRTRFHTHSDNEVARIFWGRVLIQLATSFMYFSKDSRYRNLLHELKYHGQERIGVEMGKLIGLELKDTCFNQVDIIHPVPLHKSKLRQRGYNQSELLAKGISSILQIPVETNLLRRNKGTHTQTKKSRYERWENIKLAFELTHPNDVKNRHILLVDDVITTGATIEACAQAILSAEGASVSVVSLAYAKLQ